MGLIDFITFIAAMLFLLVSSRRKRERDNPEEVEAEEQEEAERLREFLNDVNMGSNEVSTKKPLPHYQKSANSDRFNEQRKFQKPKPVKTIKTGVNEKPFQKTYSKADYDFEDKHREFESKERDAYVIGKKQENQRAKNLFANLKNPQDLILLREILGPPKALKREGIDEGFPP